MNDDESDPTNLDKMSDTGDNTDTEDVPFENDESYGYMDEEVLNTEI